MTTLTKSYESEILARVILPAEPMLSQAAAQEILRLAFSEEDRQRMANLAAKARDGVLSEEEEAEADGFERISSLLGFLKSKARVSLRGSLDE
jgi:hypothetical protein